MQTVIKNEKQIMQMSAQEYADSLGISLQAVTKRIRQDNLPEGVSAINFGRFYLIEVERANPLRTTS